MTYTFAFRGGHRGEEEEEGKKAERRESSVKDACVSALSTSLALSLSLSVPLYLSVRTDPRDLRPVDLFQTGA